MQFRRRKMHSVSNILQLVAYSTTRTKKPDIYSMKNTRQPGLHILFWIVYFGVNLFNELYLSRSFTDHPSYELFYNSVLSQLLSLCLIKIPTVYYVLYLLIPRWLRSPSRAKLALELVFVLFLMVLCYRGLIQYIIWPFIAKESPPHLTGLQYTARFFYSLLDLLQVTGIAAAIKLFRLRIAAMKNEKVLIQEKLRSEMQHLRAQINPHFLFNTLNSIYALSRAQSSATPQAVMQLSKILRYMLYETEKKTITIEEELKITLDYIELQQVRFGNKVQVNIEKNIDNTATAITPQILLPLVENAFKHGTSEVIGLSKIKLGIELIQHQLKIEVHNSLGTAKANPSEEGIGLANMRRRLELLYRDYSLVYGEKGNNFVVELNINLNSYADIELLDSGR